MVLSASWDLGREHCRKLSAGGGGRLVLVTNEIPTLVPNISGIRFVLRQS